MTRAILFDLGQVLVPFDLERGYRALAPYCSYAPQEIRARIAASGLVRPFEEGRIPAAEFVRGISAALGLEVSYEQFCELWGSIFLPETLVPESLVEALARRFRLLILSNTNVLHYAMIEQRYGIVRRFHDRVLSYEVGALKPDERIYREALRRAGCEPGECFYVDDIPEYVEAARRL
ncbi:MAG: HAD family hydrolase, partial [Bryobacteraceae bacterium]